MVEFAQKTMKSKLMFLVIPLDYQVSNNFWKARFLWNLNKDSTLAPAYFSPKYKEFDQLLRTVKKKTTVLNLDFKEFLKTSILSLICVLYAKGITIFR